MTLAQAGHASRRKVDEAAFFLGKMREAEATSHHNLADAQEQFGYYLSAFLSAARSAQQILSKEVDWPPINALRGSWPADEQTLERTLEHARDLTIHSGEGAANSRVEYVSGSNLRRERRHPLDAYGFISRLPGVPEIGIGVRVFTIHINGQEEDAVTCCAKYLALVGRIIGHFGTP